MDALAFLSKPPKGKPHPVYALAGEEDFLKRRCRDAILSLALGDADTSFAVSTYAGDKLDFSAVRNDLDTLPFLAPARVVVVEAADPFVTAHREALERYVTKPSTVGVLILDVKTFPETTRLAKALPDGAKLSCKAPAAYKLSDWAAGWAKARHGKALAADAAGLLVELVGPQMGLLDAELEKLAVAAGPAKEITAETVSRYVGRSRAADVFRILDAIGDGKPASALTILSELFAEGEAALAILGPLAAQLRKLAAVNRRVARGQPLGPAMDDAGVPRWGDIRQRTERQLRHLVRRRLEQIPSMLVEANLGMKGGSPLPERLQLERLVVTLARPREG